MEQIKILFFALSSFFGMQDANIAGEKTIVAVDPLQKEIKIIQENLFTVVLADSDTAAIKKQWNTLANDKDNTLAWAPELKNFSNKKLELTQGSTHFKACITLNYASTKDLKELGIWYNEEKVQFSINNILEQNIKTEEGKLEGNYWFFNADDPFSFTIEPFIGLPQKYKEKMVYINDMISEDK